MKSQSPFQKVEDLFQFLEQLDYLGKPLVDGQIRIQMVDIRYQPEITDETIEAMATFPEFSELDTLWISESSVTDRGAAALRGFPRIDSIDLRGTRVTDEACRTFAELPSLEDLTLEDTAISDAGLSHLAPLRSVVVLNLKGTQITDQGLKNLTAWPKLLYLYLQRCPITDAGCDAIADITSLEYVNLWNTDVSHEGCNRLRRSRPDLRIEHESRHET